METQTLQETLNNLELTKAQFHFICNMYNNNSMVKRKVQKLTNKNQRS